MRVVWLAVYTLLRLLEAAVKIAVGLGSVMMVCAGVLMTLAGIIIGLINYFADEPPARVLSGIAFIVVGIACMLSPLVLGCLQAGTVLAREWAGRKLGLGSDSGFVCEGLTMRLPEFPDFNDYCSAEYAVPDRLLWSMGEELNRRLTHAGLLQREMTVSYCVPLQTLAESQRSDPDFEYRQFRSRTVQLVVSRWGGEIICALDVTAPPDAGKEQMLADMGIRYRHFEPGADPADIAAFVLDRNAGQARPTPLFIPRQTFLTAAQQRAVNVVLRPLARRWGARLLLHTDAGIATRSSGYEPGMNFDCLMVSHDGRYAAGFILRSDFNTPENASTYVTLVDMAGPARALMNITLLTSRYRPGLEAEAIRDHMRVNVGLKTRTDSRSPGD